jgi:hypothetical protein
VDVDDGVSGNTKLTSQDTNWFSIREPPFDHEHVL